MKTRRRPKDKFYASGRPRGSFTNGSNASTNAYYRVLDFLEAQPEEWTPTCIAEELNMPRGTVSWVLSKLRRAGKVIYRKEGICNFYSASKRFSDEFTRLFKRYGTGNRYQVHGLTLRFSRGIANGVPLGGRGGGVGGVERWGFGYNGATVRFQLSKRTLMVYVSCSENPLDYDGLLLLLATIDGHLTAKDLPRILDNMAQWKVVQYGFNRDWKRFRNDSPTECVSVQGFMNWFARVYNKKPLGVLREEIHSTVSEERSLEGFLALVDGSLTSVHVINFLYMLCRNLNSVQKSNFELATKVSDLINRIDRKPRNVVNIEDRLASLEGSVHRLIEFLYKREPKTALEQTLEKTRVDRKIGIDSKMVTDHYCNYSATDAPPLEKNPLEETSARSPKKMSEGKNLEKSGL